MEKVLYNTFFTPGSRFYLSAPDDSMAAVQYPGKPVWLRLNNDANSEKIFTFFSDFIDACGDKPSGLVAPKEAVDALSPFFPFKNRWEISAFFRLSYVPELSGDENKLVVLQKRHLQTASKWLTAFYLQALHTNITAVESEAMARSLIGGKKLYGLSEPSGLSTQNEKLLAMGMIIPLSEGMSRLNLIYIPESERGKGYGRELVLKLSALIYEQGAFPVLYARTDNAPAMKLYSSIGFMEAGRLSEVRF